MSDHDVFYAAKMRELKAARARNRPLYGQLTELLDYVLQCEARWKHQYPEWPRRLPSHPDRSMY